MVIIVVMETIPAGEFKAKCLSLMDRVVRTAPDSSNCPSMVGSAFAPFRSGRSAEIPRIA